MTVLELNSVGAEEAIYYAQKIIDHFASGLRDNMCMSQIPISLYTEAQTYIDRAISIDETAFSEDVPSNVYNSKDEFISDPLTKAVKKAFKNDCISCDIDIPKIDFKAMADNLMDDIKRFLKAIASMFNFDLLGDALPALISLFNFVCIPDLVKILALLAAFIAEIIAMLFLGSFSLLAFIMAIINVIIGKLMSYVRIILNFSLTSIMCIIDTIKGLMDKIPTPNNIRKATAPIYTALDDRDRKIAAANNAKVKDNYDFNTNNEKDIRSSIEKTVDNARGDVDAEYKSINERIDDSVAAVNNKISESLSKVTDAIELSIRNFLDTIQRLLGLKTFLDSEAERAMPNIVESLENIKLIILIMNIIREVIKNKGKKYKNIINKSNGSINAFTGYVMNDTNEGLSDEEIASVIQNALGKETSLVTDGKDNIGIYISDYSIDNTKLDFFSCNLGDFIDSINIDKIITDVIDESDFLGEDITTIGNGNGPSYSLKNRIPVSSVDNTTGLFISINKSNDDSENITSIIKNVFDFANKVNVYEKEQQQEDTSANNPIKDTTVTNEQTFRTINGKIGSGLQGNNKIQLQTSIEDLGVRLSQLSTR